MPSSREVLIESIKTAESIDLKEARQKFYNFCVTMDIEPMPAMHHRLIIQKLDEVANGVLDRLMITMPPGYAKSTYASILFPPWYLAKFPRRKIVTGSYNTDLADYFGKKARSIVLSPTFSRIWRENLDPGYGKSKNEWGLLNGSEYYATGVGAGVTGRRADIILIDDPIKGRKEADSKLVRDTVWDWYMTDIRSRKKPDCGIIIINTRWHEDDLCGRILNFGSETTLDEEPRYVSGSGWFDAYDGEKWYVLSLPAIAEPGDILGRAVGEVLWPNYYTEESVYQERKSQDERNWSALWQCRPSPEEGDFFKRENFSFFDELPERLNMYGSTDYAVTSDGGDFTELGVGGVDVEDNLYICDWWSGQTDSLVWIESQFRLHRKWTCDMWFEEKGQIEKSVGPFISKKMQETGVYFSQKKIGMKTDKAQRAQVIRARMAQRQVGDPKKEHLSKVLFPSKASKYWGPWVERLMQQMLVFPAGTYDDMIDVLSLFGLGLMLIRKPYTPGKRPDLPDPMSFDQIARDELKPKSMYRG